MSENTQIVMMFCLTIIAIIGIISAVLCYSKDHISFRLKARAKLPGQSHTELGVSLDRVDKKENR